MSNRVGLPASLTGSATLSRSGEGVTLNNSSLTSGVNSPSVSSNPLSQSAISSGNSAMPSSSPTAGISMATLFGNPSLSPSQPAPLPNSSSTSSLSNLAATNPLLPSNPLATASTSVQNSPVRSPLVTATPAQSPSSVNQSASPTIFTPPSAAVQTAAASLSNQPTYSQTPLPTTLGQQVSATTPSSARRGVSPRNQTSSKRSVRSGRRENSEINVPAPVEMDVVQPEPPKKGWGYIFSPLNIIFLILVFIIVFITLYSSKLNMVTNLEAGERVLNNRKLIVWTVIITIVIAIIAFIVMSAIAKRRRR